MNIQDLATKILKLLTDEGITPNKINVALNEITEDIQLKLWEKINVSPSLLYNLKDTVWYNLEHLPLGGESKGLSDLRHLGEKYPVFMYTANDDIFIEHNKISSLLKELEDILSKWSNELIFVQLFTKSEDGWNGGHDNPSPVVIYDPTIEKPTKYGYRSQVPKPIIFDHNGEFVQSQQHETVLCSIEAKLGTYGKEPLMRQLLEQLIKVCKKALENEKGIMFEFNLYDYN